MNKDKLIEVGVDYESGVHRFADKEQIYEKYLLKFFDYDRLAVMREQLLSNDVDGAFRTAHDLKGTTGNLSLTSMYEKICSIVEKLRGGENDELVMSLFDDAQSEYDKLKAAVFEE